LTDLVLFGCFPPLTRLVPNRLFDIYSARANKNMFIQGDPDLSFGDVVRIIDIAKGSGVGDIGLMTPE